VSEAVGLGGNFFLMSARGGRRGEREERERGSESLLSSGRGPALFRHAGKGRCCARVRRRDEYWVGPAVALALVGLRGGVAVCVCVRGGAAGERAEGEKWLGGGVLCWRLSGRAAATKAVSHHLHAPPCRFSSHALTPHCCRSAHAPARPSALKGARTPTSLIPRVPGGGRRTRRSSGGGGSGRASGAGASSTGFIFSFRGVIWSTEQVAGPPPPRRRDHTNNEEISKCTKQGGGAPWQTR
jgi:hypothetical protein